MKDICYSMMKINNDEDQFTVDKIYFSYLYKT